MSKKKMLFSRNGVSPFLANLVAYYPLNSDANDYKGTNNGTPTNITYGSGKVGNSAVFNGSTSKIIIPNNIDFTPTNGTNDVPMSWSFWVNKNVNASFMQLISRRQTNGQIEYLIFIDSSNQITVSIFSSNSTSISIKKVSNIAINNSVWNNVVITYDGTGDYNGIKIYINSVLTDFNTGTGNSGTYVKCNNNGSNLALGIGEWFGGNVLDGKLDEVAIWKNRELTSTEVLEAYNLGNAGTPLI